MTVSNSVTDNDLSWAGQFLARLSQVSRALGILSIVGIFVSINIEVFGRNLFLSPTTWATEISTYLVVAATFLTTGFVAARDDNIRTDLVLQFLSDTAAETLRRAGDWISLFLAMVLGWASTGYAVESWVSGTRSWSLLGTPLWIPQSSIVVGLALLVGIQALRLLDQENLPSAKKRIAGLFLALGAIIAFGEPVADIFPREPLIVVTAMMATVAVTVLLVERRAIASTFFGFVIVALAVFLATAGQGLVVKAIVMALVAVCLLFGGLAVGFALLSLGILSFVSWLPPVSLNSIGDRAWGAVSTFELTAIPMFVLMGALLVRSEASSDLFKAAGAWMGRMKAGLALASIAASGMFAAVSGSSLATAATMGRVAGGEMVEAGYEPKLAYGVLAAGGTLGILIPPSIAMIIYGPLAGVPVIRLFMAGLVPGILMMIAFAVVVIIWTLLSPTVAPSQAPVPFAQKVKQLKNVFPILILMIFVLGSLYLGFATPTESGGLGALGAALIGGFKRRLTMANIVEAFEEAAVVTSFLLIIAVSAAVMTFGLDFLAMTQQLVSFIKDLSLSDAALFGTIILIYLVLGMFIEPISMVLITLPIILPVVVAVGWDLTWFGVILVMLVEIGLITPPVGMILFVLSGMSDGKASVATVSAGALPFVVAYLAMIALFYVFPEIITFLPTILSK